MEKEWRFWDTLLGIFVKTKPFPSFGPNWAGDVEKTKRGFSINSQCGAQRNVVGTKKQTNGKKNFTGVGGGGAQQFCLPPGGRFKPILHGGPRWGPRAIPWGRGGAFSVTVFFSKIPGLGKGMEAKVWIFDGFAGPKTMVVNDKKMAILRGPAHTHTQIPKLFLSGGCHGGGGGGGTFPGFSYLGSGEGTGKKKRGGGLFLFTPTAPPHAPSPKRGTPKPERFPLPGGGGTGGLPMSRGLPPPPRSRKNQRETHSPPPFRQLAFPVPPL